MQEAYARKMATLSASVHKPLGAPGVGVGKGGKGPNTWAALAPDDYVPFDQVFIHTHTHTHTHEAGREGVLTQVG